MTSLRDTLVSFVNVPSVTGSEGRLSTAIAERLLASCGRDGVDRIGNNLIVGRRTGRPLVLLAGHLDTVPEQGNLPARTEEGRVHGLGSSDMKGGLAVMTHLLEEADVQTGPYDVVGVFYDREEGPADENGLKVVFEQSDWLASADFGIVLEPSDLDIQLGCNGTMNAIVTFHGKAAHSARPWLGSNAVTKAGTFLASLHSREPRSVTISGLEFQEVISVTTAHGGVALNVVPARFDLNVNYRFPPDMDVTQAEERLRELLVDADEVSVTDAAGGAPVPQDNAYLDRLKELSSARLLPKQGWTDVARLSEFGIPAVNYGPGESAQAHQAGESASTEALEQAFRVLRDFLIGG